MDPSLWRVDRFEQFLEARRELIASSMNSFLESLISEPIPVQERPVLDLIRSGESATLEFKSSLQWDMVEQRVNKQLRLSVLKTIAAFLNSEGGTLMVGVEDDGNVCGLDGDLKTLRDSRDRFEQLLASLVSDNIGAHVAAQVHTRFEVIDGTTVCVLDIERATDPVFVREGTESTFYVRFGNTTQPLNAEEALRYVQTNWG